ncbi:sulfurtransferase [Bacillus taeanensis]|uniref:Sulfurtransferase n=1 Tax=Bacillus taeanensis TaxID=273032 RepID=A0A366XU83_9BACI|nr:sulfurtransferase [Bacillus taeanensis]RBW67703.1 sulfurtransferase [Bacillus taeanensis]
MVQAFVTTKWLHTHLHDKNLVIFDCRFDLSDSELGRELFENSHLPNARYLHLEKDLSGPKEKQGGRHPLPDLHVFSEKLGHEGIDRTKTVIAYDDQDGAMAARLWWLLRFIGHDNVLILNGGFSKWVQDGYPVTKNVQQPKQTVFTPAVRKEMLVSMEEVKKKLGDKKTVLIDSRDPERYKGNVEPIDPVGGHIPHAVNLFWKENIDENGIWKSEEILRDQFSSVDKNKELVVYCGSGVTACANIIALYSVGLEAKLYAGSWSDWISYEENPIVKETTADK